MEHAAPANHSKTIIVCEKGPEFEEEAETGSEWSRNTRDGMGMGDDLWMDTCSTDASRSRSETRAARRRVLGKRGA